MEEIGLTVSPINGQCWHDIFKNPVIVKGYPIPQRPEWSTGLEIPLNMMAGLARSQRLDRFRDKLYIKGFSTMLVPTKQIGDVICWHMIYNKDGSRISYLDDNVDQEQQIGRAQLKDTIRSLTRVSLSLTQVVPSPKPSFPLGVSRNGYIPRLKWISTKFVLLWDEDDKRGWLINGTSALLHIVRASLAHDSSDKFQSAFLFKSEDLKESTTPFLADSAIDVLINPENLGLKLYPEKDGYLLLESRIDHFYNILEKLIDHQTDIAGDCGGNLSGNPRSHLEGWDFEDLATNRDPLYPRVAILEAAGKGWVDFARAIHAVTLVGRCFGEIIRPTNADMCEYWAELPKQKYYIASCFSDLREVVKEHGSHEDGHSSNFSWVWGDIGHPQEGQLEPAASGAKEAGADSPSFEDSGIGSSLTRSASETSRPRSIAQLMRSPSDFRTAKPKSAAPIKNEKHGREDYTVGIICALPAELMAVRAVFSCEHNSLETGSRDSNSYVLGEIAQHMVVATCLPAGEYGTNSAAAVASNMVRSFSSLNHGFCLLVGIGGGVPSEENDIRLGDVVVGLPKGKFPGVVQYDLGKEMDGGTFERTGTLRGPPRVLTTAINILRSDPSLRFDPLGPELGEISARLPGYSHPGQKLDVLIQSFCAACRSREACPSGGSHAKQRIPRPTDAPEIHYGPIASGNRVVKSSKFRDWLEGEHGVLCFEMEAAGVVNAVDCLVIRGISDYCDGHKNDTWQNYAAATAAAYAKLLLSVVGKENHVSGRGGFGKSLKRGRSGRKRREQKA
ncbi:hypothetical protein ACO1O0_008572 [Amphichorda felina]